jgi:hypothetical protein
MSNLVQEQGKRLEALAVEVEAQGHPLAVNACIPMELIVRIATAWRKSDDTGTVQALDGPVFGERNEATGAGHDKERLRIDSLGIRASTGNNKCVPVWASDVRRTNGEPDVRVPAQSATKYGHYRRRSRVHSSRYALSIMAVVTA